MRPWENGKLAVRGRYFCNGETPFFWLGDTAWLLFANLTFDEALIYLKNRAGKGYNVIQACLRYAAKGMEDINKMPVVRYDDTEEYWQHCDKIISAAEELGLYMALLPCWGSLVKNGIINEDNAGKYAGFLAERYGKRKNVLWLLGGDMKAGGYESLYEKMAVRLKNSADNAFIGFHPFGRTSSTSWFKDADWLDFNMFQSGHRRYDQASLGAWDDRSDNSDEFYGEDNWRYVERDLSLSDKPTLDGEPSYEWILQGLHDNTQPYWRAGDVRRYAYWSVFAGAAGHTYGDNSVMQFYTGKGKGVTYGAREHWTAAMHHEGSGQMQYLKELMCSVDFTEGRSRSDLLLSEQQPRYGRVSVFSGSDFLMAHTFSGMPFVINTSGYRGFEAWLFAPSTGIYSYMGKVNEDIYKFAAPQTYNGDTDVVLLLRK